MTWIGLRGRDGGRRLREAAAATTARGGARGEGGGHGGARRRVLRSYREPKPRRKGETGGEGG
uniref:Uncharacterized protein n=1 Tax=Oryza nivara TaxID=4536 RepID=A0A679BA66_ORYNI|nr:hypothetical protein [Oryza sativa f. spontanea]